jgi:hypothetical protein
MKLSIIDNQKLQIEWAYYEQIFALNFHKHYIIPLTDIESVSTDKPVNIWLEIRHPGIIFPGLIKAGTFSSSRGKEFWYITNEQDYLILELKNQPFKRVIITINDNLIWAERINQYLPIYM